MNKKLIVVTALLLAVCVFGLVACKDAGISYGYDANEHWAIVDGVEQAKEAHRFDDGVVTTQPTAATDGVETYTCTLCGYQKTETIPAGGHTHAYTEWKFDADNHWKVCPDDDAIDESTRAAHTWDDQTPTPGDPNLIHYTCVCGATKDQRIDDGHTHAYTEWKFDADNHWKVCPDDGVMDVSTKAAHDFTNGDCVCGKEKPAIDASWVYDVDGHQRKDENGVLGDKSAHTYDKGGCVCTVCGRYSVMKEVQNAIVDSDLFNYSIVVEDLVFPTGNQSSTYLKVFAHFGFDADGELQGVIYVDMVEKSVYKIENVAKMVLSKGKVYAVVSLQYAQRTGVRFAEINYSYIEVDSYTTYSIMDDEWMFYQAFGNIGMNIGLGRYLTLDDVKEFVRMLDSYSPVVEALKVVVDKLITVAPQMFADEQGDTLQLFVESTDEQGNTVYTIDWSALKQVNTVLATATVGDYLTSIFGENYVEEIEKQLKSVFDKTVGDVIDALAEKDITVKDLLDIADMAVAIATGDNNATLEQLLVAQGMKLPEGKTLADVINDVTVRSVSVGDIFEMAQQGSQNVLTSSELVKQVVDFVNQNKAATVYDFVLVNMPDLDSETFVAIVNQAMDVLQHYVSVTATVDADGTLLDASVSVGNDNSFEFVASDNAKVTAAQEMLKSLLSGISSKDGKLLFGGKASLVRKTAMDEIVVADEIVDEVVAYYDKMSEALSKLFTDKASVEAFATEYLYLHRNQFEVKQVDGQWYIYYFGGSLERSFENEEVTKAFPNYSNFRYRNDRTCYINLNDFYQYTLGGVPCDGKQILDAYFLDRMESVTFVITVTDKATGNDIVLSQDEVDRVLGILETADSALFEQINEFIDDMESLKKEYYKVSHCFFLHDLNANTIQNFQYHDRTELHNWVANEDYDLSNLQCGETVQVSYVCSICLATKIRYYTGEHTTATRYELVGETCDDGVKIVEYCTKCNEVLNESTEFGCEKFVESRDLFANDEDNICGHWGEAYSCPCGRLSKLNIDEQWFDSVEYVPGENEFGTIRRCTKCGLTLSSMTTLSDVDKENCSATYTTTDTLTKGDKELYSKTKVEQRTGHEQTKRSIEFQPNIEANPLGCSWHGVQIEYCLCGEIFYCGVKRLNELQYDDEAEGLRYYCPDCQFSLELNNVLELIDADTCKIRQDVTVEVIGSAMQPLQINCVRTMYHCYSDFYVLADGAHSCEEGWYLAEKCDFCDDTRIYEDKGLNFGHITTCIFEYAKYPVSGDPTMPEASDTFCGNHDYLSVDLCDVCGFLDFTADCNMIPVSSENGVTVYKCLNENCNYQIVVTDNLTTDGCISYGTRKIEISGPFAHTIEGNYYEGGHNFSETLIAVDGDCENGIVRRKECLDCSFVVEFTEYGGHRFDFDNVTYTLQGKTCSDGVIGTSHCTVCGKEMTSESMRHPENMFGECEYYMLGDNCYDGYLAYRECSLCHGKEFVSEERFGHDFSELVMLYPFSTLCDENHNHAQFTVLQCGICKQFMVADEGGLTSDGDDGTTFTCSYSECTLRVTLEAITVGTGCQKEDGYKCVVYHDGKIVYECVMSAVFQFVPVECNHRFAEYGEYVVCAPDTECADGQYYYVATCTECGELVYLKPVNSAPHSSNAIKVFSFGSAALKFYGCPCGKADTYWGVEGFFNYTYEGDITYYEFSDTDDTLAQIDGVYYLNYDASTGSYDGYYQDGQFVAA